MIDTISRSSKSKEFFDIFQLKYLNTHLYSVILEDRRIRLNAWISKLIGKPLHLFKNPKLLNGSMVSKEERKDPKSLNFTLNRTKPLSYSVKPKDINAVRGMTCLGSIVLGYYNF